MNGYNRHGIAATKKLVSLPSCLPRLLKQPVTIILTLICVAFPFKSGFGKTPAYVTASFVNKNGLFIEDLRKEEVQIFEDGELRDLEFMALDEIPAVYGILFDQSILGESVREERRGFQIEVPSDLSARNVAYQLIDQYLARRSLWIGFYGQQLTIAQDFTSDGFKAKEAIRQLGSKSQFREPFLYSALFSAIMKMDARSEKRRVIIVLLDTIDAATAGKFRDLKNLLSATNVELFLISFASHTGYDRSVQPALSRGSLGDLAKVTAGDFFYTADYGAHSEDLVRRIYNQIRTLYTFGFNSDSSPDKPGKLMIRCTRPGAKVKTHPLASPVH